jgi:hypothetical protein
MKQNINILSEAEQLDSQLYTEGVFKEVLKLKNQSNKHSDNND